MEQVSVPDTTQTRTPTTTPTAARTASGGGAGDPEGRLGSRHSVTVAVNGVPHTAEVPARRLLSDFLRHDLGLTGTHVGCEHGVCGACTVLLDGQPARSCLTFAVTAHGHSVTTVEGLAAAADARATTPGSPGLSPDRPGRASSMGPVQQAFAECHGLQCGFCTPGFLTTVTAFLEETPDPTEEQAREAISGNLCRCTGYQNIVRSVLRAAELRAERATDPAVETRP
jgi:carbon-monoxide dehydrogenase small subunit